MKTILVTGATGGLGRNGVRFLLNKGYHVKALGRNTQIGQRLSDAGATFIALDLTKDCHSALPLAMQDVDAVWHCAALSSPWGAYNDFMAANVHATEHLLQAAGQAHVSRFIHISSPSIYFNFQHHLNIDESFRPTRYANAYAHTKALAEDSVVAASHQYPTMRSTILRPRAIFGEYDQVLLPRLLKLLTQGNGTLRLPRAGKVLMDLTYVGNVVAAMELATHHPDLGTAQAFNITNHQPVHLDELLTQLFHTHLKRQIRIRALPYILLAGLSHTLQCIAAVSKKEPLLTPYTVGTMQFDMSLNNDKASAQLNYVPPIAMDEALVRTAQWIKGSHYA